MLYIHKFEVALQHGGAEEGGWWFTAGSPVAEWSPVMVEDEEQANEICRALNFYEKNVRAKEEDYEFSSVLAYRSQHFEYDVSGDMLAKAFPTERPHYE